MDDDIFSPKRSRPRSNEISSQEPPKDEEEKSILLQPWQQQSTASRIYRVARSSGGKDRHSKVMTTKGLRDRRVRLSVSTAIQFYDLQDRLGYDQPSKAIDWLIKAAASAISELPSLDGVFSDQPLPLRQLKPDDEKPVEDDDDPADFSQMHFSARHHQHQQQQQHFSTCSSTSETSKSSALSLSQAKDKDKEIEADTHRHSLDPCAAATPQSSFTELLTGHLKHLQPVSFGDHHFMEQLVPGGDLLNFSISSGISGLNRGTLQSNSPSPALHHLQRFPSPGDGSNLPLFLGGAVQSSVAADAQLPAGFDSRLRLRYLGLRNSDFEGKGKS